MDNIDVDRFIFEIEHRPAIWNPKCPEYSDRAQRYKQWDEIMEIFTDRNATADEKTNHKRMLQIRWRTLRDSFVKQRREILISKGTNKKSYKYYQQLMFLLPVITTGDNNSIASDDNSELVERTNRPTIIIHEPKRAKLSDQIDESELMSVLKSTLQQKTEEEDPDRQFMLSLVGDFKRVPARLKPVVKLNILKCIVDAQSEENDVQEVVCVKHEIP